MLTIIGNSASERIIDIQRVIKKNPKIKTNVLCLDSFKKEDIPEITKKISGVVLYFGLPTIQKELRDILKEKISKKYRLINDNIIKKPKQKDKFWQQKIVQKNNLTGIPSFRFRKWENLKNKIEKNKELKYPFIVKKELSSKGNQVFLIKKFSDLNKFKTEIYKYIFQPFIENNGDFRIFMIGNEPQGIILRKGKEGDYRNNISQGGTAKNFTDQKLTKKIYTFSKKLMKIFDCDYAGVDLIYDINEKKLKFLEMNFMPQWAGFSKTTKKDIAKKLLEYAQKQNK